MTGAARSARDVARRVLARVDERGAWATLALGGELAHAGLDERDRRFATELVYGALRHQARLERALAAHADLSRARPAVRAALVIAAYQLLFLRVPAHAAVDDAVGAVRSTFGPRIAGFVNAVLRKLGSSGEPALPIEPRARAAIEHSLPPWIVSELAEQLPSDEVVAAVAALKAQAPLWIRVNRLRATPAAVTAALLADGATVEPTALDDHALAVRGLGEPTRAPGFRAGHWTVQDLAAQLVGRLVAPAPGLRILDACAGVGGKTTHLAELANSAALIDAIDPQAAKLALADQSARRLGLTGITARVTPLAHTAAEPVYDRVLVDAPCSGIGVLRRHPEAAARLTRDDVTALAAVQRELLALAAARVAPGGALIYAVCTITRAEGPAQLAGFLRDHPQWRLAPTGLDPALIVDGAVRTWPHRHDADGFFAVRLERAR